MKPSKLEGYSYVTKDIMCRKSKRGSEVDDS